MNGLYKCIQRVTYTTKVSSNILKVFRWSYDNFWMQGRQNYANKCRIFNVTPR